MENLKSWEETQNLAFCSGYKESTMYQKNKVPNIQEG